jgi:glycosyltransferase involved in cell wall biosynthesis
MDAARHDAQNQPSALILGRALHAPWNEGARLIGHNLARVAAELLPVDVISLTRAPFSQAIAAPADDLVASHVLTRLPYGAIGDYVGLRALARRVAALLQERRVLVAHLIGLPLTLALWLRRQGLRVVAHATLDGHAHLGQVERLRETAARALDGAVDSYACTSELVRARLARQGCPPTKLSLVPPVIDTARFTRMPRGQARAWLGLPADAFVVVYVGSLFPQRFPPARLLPALCAAQADIPNLLLVTYVPGATHPYNAELAATLARAAQACRLPAQIVKRDLDEAAKVAAYSAADAVLLPFAAPVAVEPPLTLLEALACEAPVIVSPHANRSKLVSHWSNGLVAHSPAGLARALRQLAQLDGPRAKQLGRAGRRTVEASHSFAAGALALQALWAALGVWP